MGLQRRPLELALTLRLARQTLAALEPAGTELRDRSPASPPTAASARNNLFRGLSWAVATHPNANGCPASDPNCPLPHPLAHVWMSSDASWDVTTQCDEKGYSVIAAEFSNSLLYKLWIFDDLFCTL